MSLVSFILRLVHNLALRQRCLQPLHTVRRHAGVRDMQFLQLAEAGQVRQAGIGDLRAAEVQKLKFDQRLELRQANIRDRRVVEIEPLQATERFQRPQAAVVIRLV